MLFLIILSLWCVATLLRWLLARRAAKSNPHAKAQRSTRPKGSVTGGSDKSFDSRGDGDCFSSPTADYDRLWPEESHSFKYEESWRPNGATSEAEYAVLVANAVSESFADADHSRELHARFDELAGHAAFPDTNPATGFPMIEAGVIDVAGNPFGSESIR